MSVLSEQIVKEVDDVIVSRMYVKLSVNTREAEFGLFNRYCYGDNVYYNLEDDVEFLDTDRFRRFHTLFRNIMNYTLELLRGMGMASELLPPLEEARIYSYVFVHDQLIQETMAQGATRYASCDVRVGQSHRFAPHIGNEDVRYPAEFSEGWGRLFQTPPAMETYNASDYVWDVYDVLNATMRSDEWFAYKGAVFKCLARATQEAIDRMVEIQSLSRLLQVNRGMATVKSFEIAGDADLLATTLLRSVWPRALQCRTLDLGPPQDMTPGYILRLLTLGLGTPQFPINVR